MIRTPKPKTLELPVSGKRLMGVERTCAFLDIAVDSLARLRADADERFPEPLQILRGKPLWALDDLEQYVARKQKEVASLSRR